MLKWRGGDGDGDAARGWRRGGGQEERAEEVARRQEGRRFVHPGWHAAVDRRRWRQQRQALRGVARVGERVRRRDRSRRRSGSGADAGDGSARPCCGLEVLLSVVCVLPIFFFLLFETLSFLIANN